jgi:Ca2+-binding RTX toxin-like protein
MARITYNPATTTVSFGDIAALSVGQASIVTANATTLHVRTTVSGVITGTLDVVFTGEFTLTAGFVTGGAFTGLRVDFNNQTLLTITDFSLPLSATQQPDLDGIVGQILGGADVLTGAALADVLEGFAGADNIDGAGGLDIINGNMGNDTVTGGDGADVVRGGRDDDLVLGGAGADFLSGDRGSDTVTGGAGADTFHTFDGAGLDRITDFNAGEGDRVVVFASQTYTVSQSGADTLLDLGGGNQMLLVGVQQSSLPAGWIFTI